MLVVRVHHVRLGHTHGVLFVMSSQVFNCILLRNAFNQLASRLFVSTSARAQRDDDVLFTSHARALHTAQKSSWNSLAARVCIDSTYRLITRCLEHRSSPFSPHHNAMEHPANAFIQTTHHIRSMRVRRRLRRPSSSSSPEPSTIFAPSRTPVSAVSARAPQTCNETDVDNKI